MPHNTPFLAKSILVAVDGSENSRRAVEHVAAVLVCSCEFMVTLLHVIAEPDPDYFDDSPARRLEWMGKERREAETYLEEYKRILTGAGLPSSRVTVEVKEMDCPSIAQCILAQRESLGADIIVLGRQGRGAREELLLGSVSKRVVHHAHKCAIWIVT
ncbi:UspA domain-containing protein [Desulfovibrio sp. X2]|uniref:universal stress protein n=1 Tax=Desulfovibrio sp. X2 TaxID=941449 RepID=UPI000358898F|nr:universal stress protein [Desulfovibrio sp. X2]EPR43979.1 UspA domain-containing protein [Desulfovibrio sp. X2]